LFYPIPFYYPHILEIKLELKDGKKENGFYFLYSLHYVYSYQFSYKWRNSLEKFMVAPTTTELKVLASTDKRFYCAKNWGKVSFFSFEKLAVNPLHVHHLII